MLARYLMIFAVMFTVSACSSDDDAAMEEQATLGAESTTGTANDIYGDGGQDQGAAPGTQADFVVNVGDRVFFGYDQYDLSQEARDTLGRQAN